MSIPFQDLGLLVAALLSAAVTSTAGVSSSVLLMVIGLMWVAPIKLIVLIALYSLTINLVRLKGTWGSIDGKAMGWLLLGAIPGAWLGAQVLVMLPQPLLRQVVGAIALVYVVLELLHDLLAASPNVRIGSPFWLPMVGLLYGGVSGTCGLQGLSRMPFLARFGVIRRKVLGTAALAAVLVSVTKLITYQSLDLFTPRRWMFGGLLVLASWMGAATGKDLFRSLAGKAYQRVLLVVVAALAVSLILRPSGY